MEPQWQGKAREWRLSWAALCSTLALAKPTVKTRPAPIMNAIAQAARTLVTGLAIERFVTLEETDVLDIITFHRPTGGFLEFVAATAGLLARGSSPLATFPGLPPVVISLLACR